MRTSTNSSLYRNRSFSALLMALSLGGGSIFGQDFGGGGGDIIGTGECSVTVEHFPKCLSRVNTLQGDPFAQPPREFQIIIASDHDAGVHIIRAEIEDVTVASFLTLNGPMSLFITGDVCDGGVTTIDVLIFPRKDGKTKVHFFHGVEEVISARQDLTVTEYTPFVNFSYETPPQNTAAPSQSRASTNGNESESGFCGVSLGFDAEARATRNRRPVNPSAVNVDSVVKVKATYGVRASEHRCDSVQHLHAFLEYDQSSDTSFLVPEPLIGAGTRGVYMVDHVFSDFPIPEYGNEVDYHGLYIGPHPHMSKNSIPASIWGVPVSGLFELTLDQEYFTDSTFTARSTIAPGTHSGTLETRFESEGMKFCVFPHTP